MRNRPGQPVKLGDHKGVTEADELTCLVQDLAGTNRGRSLSEDPFTPETGQLPPLRL